MGIVRKQITPYSPWQNGATERWVQTVRRDLLDHVIVLNERHLHRKSPPSMRVPASKPNGDAEIVGHPRIGGLRHRYEWRQAA